jgi:Holliday junction resolvase-like predicted endonuclease
VQVGRSEVDLVALDGDTVVLVEVKSRTVTANVEWTGLDRVDANKRRALRRAGAILRGRVRGGDENFRVDAVSVEFEKRSVGHRVVDLRWYPGILKV